MGLKPSQGIDSIPSKRIDSINSKNSNRTLTIDRNIQFKGWTRNLPKDRLDRMKRSTRHLPRDSNPFQGLEPSPLTNWQQRTTWVCGWSMATSKPRVWSRIFSLLTSSCAWTQNLNKIRFWFVTRDGWINPHARLRIPSPSQQFPHAEISWMSPRWISMGGNSVDCKGGGGKD